MHGFLIAGTNSGCGKTTISIGLMSLLQSLGKKVAPFKTGPDYIDPLFHSKVLNTPSYNLDSFMLSEETNNHLFSKHINGTDIAVVEGVMGMYDGMGKSSVGSSHHLSKILKLPVILVVNCKSLYQSVSAIVKGFSTLKENANVKGVILNHVPSEDYYTFLKEVVERDCNVKCIGYVPTDKEIVLESRHLGLIQAEEVDGLSKKIARLTKTLSETIDVETLLEISKVRFDNNAIIETPELDLSDLHIGVAHDKAFRFYYTDNIELLKELGAHIYYFSPLKDKSIPKECNCLYIGGGYPEVFADELSKNIPLLENLNKVISSGMPAYAECGGLMYLAESVVTTDGFIFPLTGVFNISVQMTQKLQRFGYAELEYEGTKTKCHEFHRSKVVTETEKPNYKLEYKLKKPEKQKEWECGLKMKNCLAGYAHVHFYSNFGFFEKIVKLWKQATI